MMRQITILVAGFEQPCAAPDQVALRTVDGVASTLEALHDADGIVSAFRLSDGTALDLLDRTSTDQPVVVVGGDVSSDRLLAAGAADHFAPPIERPQTAIQCLATRARTGHADPDLADSALSDLIRSSPSRAPKRSSGVLDRRLATDGGRDSESGGGDPLEFGGQQNLRLARDSRDAGTRIPVERTHGHPDTEPSVPVDLSDVDLDRRAMDKAPIAIAIIDPTSPDNPLVYVNTAFERMTGYSSKEVIGQNYQFLRGENTDSDKIARMQTAIDTQDPATVELRSYRADGDSFWNRIDLEPVETADGESYFVSYQTEITADRAENGAANQQPESRRRDESPDSLSDRLQRLIGGVTRAATEPSSREELEQQVCERFAAADGYFGGWFGRREMTSDQVVARTQVACGGAENIAVPLHESGHDPTRQALETGQVTVAAVTDLPSDSPHRRVAPSKGSVAAIPLQFGETRHGVLTVYTSAAHTLDERDRTILESLGRVTTAGINQLQSQRLLTANEFRRLVFKSSDRDLFFIELSEELDSTLEFKGTVSGADDGLRLAFLIEDAAPEAVRQATEGTSVTDATVATSFDSGCLFEFVMAEDESFLSTVIANGGSISAVSATGGVAELTVEVPVGSDVQPVVSRIQDRYPQTKLVSQRTEARSKSTNQEFVAAVEEALTDRQFTVLRKAHISGFYEWPRDTSGKDIAESMGIDRSTFHQHLRAAERKIVDRVLDDADDLPGK